MEAGRLYVFLAKTGIEENEEPQEKMKREIKERSGTLVSGKK